MIQWDRQRFEDCGFTYEESQIVTTHFLNFQGNVLKYQVIIDTELGQVSASGDTSLPFGGNSLYEIYARFQIIRFANGAELLGRRFLIEFYDSVEPSDETLRLQISGRLSDNELIVWPYVKGRLQAC